MYMTIHQQMIEIMHKYYTDIKIGGFDFQVEKPWLLIIKKEKMRF